MVAHHSYRAQEELVKQGCCWVLVEGKRIRVSMTTNMKSIGRKNRGVDIYLRLSVRVVLGWSLMRQIV